MSDPFIGEISLFAGNFAPRGWAFCEGQLLQISSNTALFSLLGTMYGGDGRTTFGLPDLRGRVAIGSGRGPGLPDYRQGTQLGEESVTLGVTQIPSHAHAVSPPAGLAASTGNADTHEATTSTVLGVATVQGNPGLNTYSTEPADTDLEGAAGTLSLANTGGSQSHSNLAPFLVVNHIIALTGTYPSRA